MVEILTRFGDGSPVALSQTGLSRDLKESTSDAADRGSVDPLSEDELKHLFDIFASPYRFVSVEPCKVSVSHLTDPVLMSEVRQDLRLGTLHPVPNSPQGIDAKINID